MPRTPGAKQREYHRDLMRRLRARAHLLDVWVLFPRQLGVDAAGMPSHSDSVETSSIDWRLDRGIV